MFRREARLILLAVELFVAATSIVCGLGLAVGVIQFPLTFLDGSPFGDYVAPGLLMAIVVGGVPLLAAAALRARHVAGLPLSALAGLILLAFEVVEVVTIDRNTGGWLPLVLTLQSAYTALGLVMLALAAYLWAWAPARKSPRLRHARYG